MPSFIVLCKFEDGVDLAQLDFDPAAVATERMLEAGGALQSLWVTGGEFDMVAVVEAVDSGSSTGFLPAFTSLGRVRTMTLSAESALPAGVAVGGDAKTNIGGGDAKTNIGGGGDAKTNIGGGGDG